MLHNKYTHKSYFNSFKIKIPRGFNGEVLFEVELGVVIGKTCKFVKEENAFDYVLGYVLSLDMTANFNMKEYPILLIKGFDTSCPLGKFIPKSDIKDPDNVNLTLSVNGVTFQDGNTRDLLFKIPKLISYISEYFTLEYGDLILTGTPANRSTTKHGDLIVASMGDLDRIEFPVVEIGV
jgi:acylpyruvate hydrolase